MTDNRRDKPKTGRVAASMNAGAPAGLVKLFYRIGEVAHIVGVAPHVLRYWESEFPTLKPQKSTHGQRVYTKRDVHKLLLIKHLLKEQGLTIAGARKQLRVQGAKLFTQSGSSESSGDKLLNPTSGVTSVLGTAATGPAAANSAAVDSEAVDSEAVRAPTAGEESEGPVATPSRVSEPLRPLATQAADLSDVPGRSATVASPSVGRDVVGPSSKSLRMALLSVRSELIDWLSDLQ